MLSGVLNDEKAISQDKNNSQFIPCLIVILAVIYNALLAFVNINITPMSMQHVIIFEVLIVLMGTGYLFLNRKRLPNLMPHISFLFVAFILSSVVMVANGELFIKIIRDMLIVVLFILMGTLMDKETIIKTFKILTILSLVFILIEVFKSDFYISLFNPASYYLNTRGIEPLGDSGFFRNTITSNSRFSFNFFSENRTSSIFLEQVSLANFSTILTIFVITFWKFLSRKEIILFIASILFFLLTNDSRTGSVLAVVLFLGYFIFPKLVKYSHFLIMPSILILAVALFYDPSINATNWGDDLKGRLGLTAFKLSQIDFKTAIFGHLGNKIYSAADSGFVYFIYALSVFGLIAYWLYTSYILNADHTAMAKRFAWGVSLFISINLLTSAAIFTIKVVAPLWIIGGYLYHQSMLEKKAIYRDKTINLIK